MMHSATMNEFCSDIFVRPNVFVQTFFRMNVVQQYTTDVLFLKCITILFSQKILRKLGHRVVSSDEEESQTKPEGPSEKAWGKRKSTFYNTDFIDDELGGNIFTCKKEKKQILAVMMTV